MSNQNWNNNSNPDPNDPPAYGSGAPDEAAGNTPSYTPPGGSSPAGATGPGTGGYNPPSPYGPPQSNPGQVPPAQPGGYNPPAQSGGYGAPGQSGGYNPPAQSGGYGAPGQPGGYNPPAQPAAGSYGAPTPSPYGAPMEPAGQAPGQYGAPGGYSQANFPAQGNMNQPYPGGAVAMGGLAEWPKRAVGGLIDYVVPGIIYNIAMVPFQAHIDTTTGTIVGGNGLMQFVLWLALMGWFAYNSWYLGGNTGYSIGRRIAKVKLVDEATGQPIGLLKAFLRHLAHIIDSLICLVGWLFPLWDAKKQTIADKIMKTVVINTDGQS